MKKNIFPILAIATLLYFTGCDKVNEQEYLQPVDVNSSLQKILIEDYTGHTCGNCPAAAVIAQNLKKQYGDKIIVMSIHTGFFAKPKAGNYAADFRCATGDELEKIFQVAAVGNPNGMVNRQGVPTKTHVKAKDDWATLTANILSKNAKATIGISNTIDTTGGSIKLNTSATVRFLQNITQNTRLVTYLTEDSIVSYQTDYSKTPNDVPNYVQHHVLRTALNGTFGDDFTIGATPINSEKTKKFSTFTIDPAWKYKHCTVVTVLYDKDTYEVIQVEEKPITQR